MYDLKKFLKTSQRYLNILKSNGIDTPKKFFEYWPRDYEDRRKVKKLSEILLDGTIQIVKGKVLDKKLVTTPTGKKLIEVLLHDEYNVSFKVHYLNASFWIKQFEKGKWYLVIGKPKVEHRQLIFWHPEIREIIQSDSSKNVSNFKSFDIGRIYPIYSELGGIKSSWFAKKIWENLDKIGDYFKECYPEEFLKKYNLISVVCMVKNLHFPENEEILKKAKYRLWFDKLLRIQLVSLLNKEDYRRGDKIVKDSNLKNIDKIIYEIIDCAFKIYNRYGNLLKKDFYQVQLKKCLGARGFDVLEGDLIKSKDDMNVSQMDLLVNGKIIIEIKLISKLLRQHFKQIKAYLKKGEFEVGVLLNFGGKDKLEYKIFDKNFSVVGEDIKLFSTPDRDLIKQFLQTLPFQLTKDQKKAVKQIIDDFHDLKPMLRLLQGDVGSGKTIVAIIAAWYMIKVFKKQVVFLAPTEILAKQHYKNITKLLLPLGIRVELLVGSMSKVLKQNVKSGLKSGNIFFVVGTHALIQEDIEFKDLGFVIIDEQHRFGVEQRAFFKKFGSPHILQMTATPIPRSLALAFFGEFDVSIIKEKPVGRKSIFTKIITEEEFIKLKFWILSKIKNGQQVYIITPLIEESEKMDDVKDVMNEYEEIKNLFPEIKEQICYLHGKMKPKEKDKIMESFKTGRCKILVSTTVVEVGIDVLQATIIIVKNSERFGLAQLHQLRGRVGRGELQSYCFLVTKTKSGDAYKRLKAMEQYNDGFKLAELDMQFRGAGEFLGTKQSGVSDIPISILANVKFLEKIQEAAKRLLNKYPDLKGLDYLRKQIIDQDQNLLV